MDNKYFKYHIFPTGPPPHFLNKYIYIVNRYSRFLWNYLNIPLIIFLKIQVNGINKHEFQTLISSKITHKLKYKL